MSVPLYKNLHGVIIKILRSFGGTASVEDVERGVANIFNLSVKDRTKIHRGKQTKLSNRVAWSRYYLKTKGFLESSKRGICVLSEKGKSVDIEDL